MVETTIFVIRYTTYTLLLDETIWYTCLNSTINHPLRDFYSCNSINFYEHDQAWVGKKLNGEGSHQ